MNKNNVYSVYSLEGKIVNFRGKKGTSNRKLDNIAAAFGFQITVDFQNFEGMRYGHLMLLTDQDSDSAHINGLVMSLLHHHWPNLLKQLTFFQDLPTYLIKIGNGL